MLDDRDWYVLHATLQTSETTLRRRLPKVARDKGITLDKLAKQIRDASTRTVRKWSDEWYNKYGKRDVG
jgi:hypothetical protein